MHLPAAHRHRFRATNQWQPIALQFPQQSILVRVTAASDEFDVTANNAVAALKPLTVTIGLDERMRAALESTPTPELHFIDRARNRLLGALHLHRGTYWSTADTQLGLFEVQRGAHWCAPWLRRAWDSWMYRRADRRNAHKDAFALAPEAVEQTQIFYICPRPVFLVSVADGEHSNIFPMDLVGPTLHDRFTLALRNSSPSVETIRRARRVAFSSVAAVDCQAAYQLGAHHKKQTIDPAVLPFRISHSREFALPVPATALRVREIEVLGFRSIGSHTLFVGRSVSDEVMAAAPQLFHTCGIHHGLRARLREPFEPAVGVPAG